MFKLIHVNIKQFLNHLIVSKICCSMNQLHFLIFLATIYILCLERINEVAAWNVIRHNIQASKQWKGISGIQSLIVQLNCKLIRDWKPSVNNNFKNRVRHHLSFTFRKNNGFFLFSRKITHKERYRSFPLRFDWN